MARAATSPELALFRTPGQWSQVRAAVYVPNTVYTFRINQSFSTRDKVLELAYDGGSGTLANVLEGMTVFIGSSAGAWDKGITRVRSIDSDTVFIGETSDIRFQDNDFGTIVDSFELWARPVLISSAVAYMDGGIAYSDQHTNLLPIIRGGSTARVLKKTGATVSTQFDFSVLIPGSSVSSRSTSAAGSSSVSGGTTQTPTITYNSVGWKVIYHTVNCANGKSFFIVRYVFVYDATNLPEPVGLNENPRGDTDSGGWSAGVTLYDNASLSQVRDHALIVLFTEDHYGATADEIGPLDGCENIIFCGWIAGESIRWLSEGGAASFKAYTAHYFLQKIPAWPDGVEFTTAPPSNWTQFKNLTVDLGLIHHFLQWRTTAPRIIDIYPSGDTKYTKEVSSLSGDLWSQINEMAFDQIFARPLCNRYGQLYIEVHPQLIPEASRTHPTVMTLLERDFEPGVEISRATMDEASIVDLSGVSVNSSGVGTAYFSLSPGHSHSHYGSPIVQNRLLLSSQAQANELAGLYRGWINNPYEPLSFKLSANNRLIDICPLQKCALSIASGDTVRELADSLGLIPLSVEDVFEPGTGYYYQEIVFEAETFEDLAVKGETPGSGNVSIPPLPPLPPLPPFVPIIPGVYPVEEEGPFSRVVMHGPTFGLLYAEDFDASSPTWQIINSGLDETQYQEINSVIPTPSGGLLVAARGFGSAFIAYATAPGETFTILEDPTSILAKFPGYTFDQSVIAIGVDPLSGVMAYVIAAGDPMGGHIARIYVGDGVSFTPGDEPPINYNFPGSLSYGFGQWRLMGVQGASPRFITFDAAGAGIILNVDVGGTSGLDSTPFHIPISSTDETINVYRSAGILRITANGAVAGDFSSVIGSGVILTTFGDNHFASDPTGQYLMTVWDTGNRGKSSDGGATWAGLPTLPAGGAYAFEYAGGEGTASRWIAARGVVRLSEDFGGTWDNREGNLGLVAPLELIDLVKVMP